MDEVLNIAFEDEIEPIDHGMAISESAFKKRYDNFKFKIPIKRGRRKNESSITEEKSLKLRLDINEQPDGERQKRKYIRKHTTIKPLHNTRTTVVLDFHNLNNCNKAKSDNVLIPKFHELADDYFDCESTSHLSIEVCRYFIV
jgi:hypothetical protein